MEIKVILILTGFLIFFFTYLASCVYRESKKFEERINNVEKQNVVLEGGHKMIKNILSKKKPYDPYYKGFTSNDDIGKTAGDFRMERDIAVAKLGDKINEYEELLKDYHKLNKEYDELLSDYRELLGRTNTEEGENND